MATSMWRMNGLCRKMTGPLVLCTLLLSSVVICQDTTVSTEVATTVASTDKGPVDSTAASQNESATSSVEFTMITVENTDNIISATNAEAEAAAAGNNALAAEAPDSSSNADTKKSENTETSSSSGSSVFVGILVTGLLAALGIIAGYFYCQRRPNSKGMKLTDKAFPEDQENQGSTLASVAPLNPPPETQEKPSVNGESPEAAKTQPPPPTNGHSTTKTADTEL